MTYVTDLFLKLKKGNYPSMPVVPVQELKVNQNGIVGAVPAVPNRQVLILPQQTLTEFQLSKGQLGENILIEGFDIHELDAGTVISIGEVDIRLNFHCEPCINLKDHFNVDLKAIRHKRGYLGTFLNEGTIHLGDELNIKEN